MDHVSALMVSQEKLVDTNESFRGYALGTLVGITHTLDMDWMLPGFPPTERKVEFVLVGIIQFQADKVANEHIHWDQATVLSQLGVVDYPVAASGARSAARLTKLSRSTPPNAANGLV